MSQNAAEIVNNTPVSKRRLYQSYSLEEESQRIAYHYDVPPQFFTTITGGDWHCYSSSMFEEGESLTQAQERKFNIYAEQMHLRPGMRILDIGSGWGGPLVYLTKTYGVTGHGITVTPAQIDFSRNRARTHRANATFELCHWAEFEDEQGFDAIYTDEMLAHVSDLGEFYAKCRRLLKPGGWLVNKELFLNERKHQDWSDRLSMHVNRVFGFTGNYRLLEDNNRCAEENGLRVAHLLDIPMENYTSTVRDHWLPNLYRNKEYLVQLTSKTHVDDIYRYLRGTLICFRNGTFNQKLVTHARSE